MYAGLLILIIPALGLVAALRSGRWSWRIFDDGRRSSLSTSVLNAIFWFGFFGATLVALLVLFRVYP